MAEDLVSRNLDLHVVAVRDHGTLFGIHTLLAGADNLARGTVVLHISDCHEPSARNGSLGERVGEGGGIRLLDGIHVAGGIGDGIEGVTNVTDVDLVVLLDSVRRIARLDKVVVQVIVTRNLEVIFFSPIVFAIGFFVDNVDTLPLDKVGNQFVFLCALGGVAILVASCYSYQQK